MAQHNAAVTAIFSQVPQYVQVFLYHPKYHFWAVAFMHHHALAWRLFFGERQHGKITYVLIHQ